MTNVAKNMIVVGALTTSFLLVGCDNPVNIPQTDAYCTTEHTGNTITATVTNAYTKQIILTAENLKPQPNGTLQASNDSNDIKADFLISVDSTFTVNYAEKTCHLYNGLGIDPTYVLRTDGPK